MDTLLSDSANVIVIIDDDQDHLQLMERSVRAAFAGDDRRVEIQTHLSPGEGLAQLQASQRTVILLADRLTGATGLAWLSDFLGADVGPVILITGSEDEEIAAEAFRRGASDLLVRSDGEQSPALVRKTIIGALRRYRMVQANRDLACRLKRSNSELDRKNARLSELTSVAHRYVDDVAHEFRTPLAVVQEFASIVSDGIGGEVTPDQTKYLAYIVDASRDLANLIDNFLDSGKLRAQTLRVDRREHDVAGLLDRAWPMVERRANAKGITLQRRDGVGLPAVFADSDKYRRTVVNLVLNAIKFSGPGATLVISTRAQGEDTVVTEVSDVVPGLHPDAVSRLRIGFSQGVGPDQGSAEGLGLGLSIVKDLAMVNLGEVSVRSVPGEGSAFGFTVPRSDPVCVLDAFLRITGASSAHATISCLRVTSNDSDRSGEELYASVANECHATDFLWMGDDGRSLIAIGVTGESDRWLNRLRTRLGITGSVRITALGQWFVGEARSALLDLISPSNERRSHAEIHSHH